MICIVIYADSYWFLVINRDLKWFILIYCDLYWYIVIHIVIYSDFWWFMMIYADSYWFIVINWDLNSDLYWFIVIHIVIYSDYPSGRRSHITMERSTILNGQTTSMATFSAIWHYNLPEGSGTGTAASSCCFDPVAMSTPDPSLKEVRRYHWSIR